MRCLTTKLGRSLLNTTNLNLSLGQVKVGGIMKGLALTFVARHLKLAWPPRGATTLSFSIMIYHTYKFYALTKKIGEDESHSSQLVSPIFIVLLKMFCL